MVSMIIRDEKGRFVKGSKLPPNLEKKRRESLSKVLRGRRLSREAVEKMRKSLRRFWKRRTPEEDRERRMKISRTMKKRKLKALKNNPNWKGGRWISREGYVYILKPDWPSARKDGYVLEHRYVIEKVLGRTLSRNESVHHKNGNKADNRLENLIITVNRMHFGNVSCPYCLKEFRVK